MRRILISLFCISFCGFLCFGQKPEENERKHIVKVNLAPIAVGEIMPSYEYLFNDKVAIEGGIGFVTENYLRQFIQESITGQTRKLKYGPSFLVSGRYYPFRSAEIIYCKAEIKFRRYRELYQQLNNDGGFESIKEYEQRVMPRFGMGYHLFLDQHFFLDCGANIGLSFIKEYQFGYNDAIKNTRFHFGIDFKFAYCF